MGIITDILKDIPLSAVLRERLADQETKMAALEAENTTFKKANSDLKSLVVNLRQEIQRRDDIIQKEKSHDNLLSDIEVKILLYLASNNNKPSKQIAAAIDITDTVVNYHLVEMNGKSLVASYAPDIWCLEHKGRKYLIENKLIS